MDMLVGFSNCPHPLDPKPALCAAAGNNHPLPRRPALATISARTATAEAISGFENNALALA
jgi:uncharacterized protein YcgI (DUF1989 family)